MSVVSALASPCFDLLQAAIQKAANELTDGDIFVVHYSGHGRTTRSLLAPVTSVTRVCAPAGIQTDGDKNNDEAVDGRDEALVAADARFVTDDRLKRWIGKLHKGVKLTFIAGTLPVRATNRHCPRRKAADMLRGGSEVPQRARCIATITYGAHVFQPCSASMCHVDTCSQCGARKQEIEACHEACTPFDELRERQAGVD
jgi:hypothetical protein